MERFLHRFEVCGMEDFRSQGPHAALHEECTCGKWAHATHTQKRYRDWVCLRCGRRFKTPREDV